MVFETRKIPLETLGEYLKAARATFNLSLEQVALASKVNPKWLGALEEGKLELLPADVYIHGTLRRLAVFYNLDAETLLFQYNKERGISKHIAEKKNKGKNQLVGFWRKLIITPKVLVAAAAVVFVGFTLLYLVWQVLAINRTPSLEITYPKDQQIIENLAVDVKGKTDPGMSVSVNGQEIYVDNFGEFGTQLSLVPGSQEIKVVSKNRFDKETFKTIKVFVQPKEVANDFKVILELAFTAPVVITYKIDELEEITKAFINGDVVKIEAKNSIIISASDGGNILGKLNGRDLNVLGKPGERLDVTFSKESANIK